jgi:hypothetical protein
MRKLVIALLILLRTPSISLASMDLPTISSTLPPMLCLGLVFIGSEIYVFSKTLKTKKKELLKITGSVYIGTVLLMIAFSWVGMGVHHILQKLLGRLLGTYVGIQDPSNWDKLYTATIGCFYLPSTEHIVVAGVAIISFLIPVFVSNGIAESKMLRNKIEAGETRTIIIKTKIVELIAVWIGSIYIFFKHFNG